MLTGSATFWPVLGESFGSCSANAANASTANDICDV